MSDLYTVRFVVDSEPTRAQFESEKNATWFSDRLAFAGIDAVVIDEFADREDNPVCVAKPQPLPNGLYLVADTPKTLTALAVEDGSGDRELLQEVLIEHGIVEETPRVEAMDDAE